MVIRVNIPEELVARARACGVPVETYVEQLLAQQVAAASEHTRRLETPEQVRAWLDSLAQFSDKIPPLPETISREWIYQDHD
jgi:post-segregation antitoxin (ccd killing protein)